MSVSPTPFIYPYGLDFSDSEYCCLSIWLGLWARYLFQVKYLNTPIVVFFWTIHCLMISILTIKHVFTISNIHFSFFISCAYFICFYLSIQIKFPYLKSKLVFCRIIAYSKINHSNVYKYSHWFQCYSVLIRLPRCSHLDSQVWTEQCSQKYSLSISNRITSRRL